MIMFVISLYYTILSYFYMLWNYLEYTKLRKEQNIGELPQRVTVCSTVTRDESQPSGNMFQVYKFYLVFD